MLASLVCLAQIRFFAAVNRASFDVQPIPLGVTFSNAVSKFKAQSSNVSFLTFQWKMTFKFELWALSFERAFENVTPSGIGCQTTDVCHD